MLDQSIPLRLQDALTHELEPGERVEWTGMPKPRYFSSLNDFGTFLIAIGWTALSVYLLAAVAEFKVPDFNQLFDGQLLGGLLFLSVGIVLLLLPLRTHRNYLNILYAITNRNIMTIKCGRLTEIQSCPHGEYTVATWKEHPDGTDDIVFARRLDDDDDEDSEDYDSEEDDSDDDDSLTIDHSVTYVYTEHIEFLGVTDGKEVERRLETLADEGAAPSGTEDPD